MGGSCQVRDNTRDQKILNKTPLTIETKAVFTLAPIWFPHWPTWMWTISRILTAKKSGLKMNENAACEGDVCPTKNEPLRSKGTYL